MDSQQKNLKPTVMLNDYWSQHYKFTFDFYQVAFVHPPCPLHHQHSFHEQFTSFVVLFHTFFYLLQPSDCISTAPAFPYETKQC